MCVFRFFFVTLVVIGIVDAFNTTGCGPDEYQSEDEGCQPCLKICIIKRIQRHYNFCRQLCPEFYSRTSSKNAKPDLRPHSQNSASDDNRAIYVTLSVVVSVGIITTVVFFVLWATGKLPRCRRKNGMGKTTTDAIQETQQPLMHTAVPAGEDGINQTNLPQADGATQTTI